MRRRLAPVAFVAVLLALAVPASAAAASASIAALQVALRRQGLYTGQVDGVVGPLTRSAVIALQRRERLPSTGRVGPLTRRALGPLGAPLLGQRELGPGSVGWDVSALEFRLVAFGLPRGSVDGRFTDLTRRALQRFQSSSGLRPDGIAGVLTYRALARRRASARARAHRVRPGEGFYTIAARYRVGAGALARANSLDLTSLLVPGQRLRLPNGAAAAPAAPAGARPGREVLSAAVHVVRPGESFYSIAARWSVSPWSLARVNGLSLGSVLVPAQRLQLPAGARVGLPQAPREHVRVAIDRWSAAYGVDPRLARALAWMESGFQPDVVSEVGAIGVMQLLPETWDWVDEMLIGQTTPRTYEGNVRAGVRYLRWQLDQFGGDVRLALAGWYQGARAVREIGLYDDTKQFVTVVRMLYGTV